MTYSFCYSVPYGVIVICGGLIGFMKKGSVMSLVMGLLFGGLSLLFGMRVKSLVFWLIKFNGVVKICWWFNIVVIL